MDNRRRVLAQTLMIDAWHDPLQINGSQSAVHVELSFQQGHLGGDDEAFPFTFNIGMKRALLTVSLERPLELDRRSVARNIPKNDSELTQILQMRDAIKKDRSLSGKVSLEKMSLALSGHVEDSQTASKENRVKIVQHIPRIIATPRPEGPHAYSWNLTPSYEEVLDGQPWDPVEAPRFLLKPLDYLSRIEPIITATISCELQDIEISDFRLKDQSISAALREAVFPKVNEAAAIQHLKLTLREMNLEVGKFEDKFSRLIIGETVSVPA